MADLALQQHLHRIETHTDPQPVIAFFDMDRTLIAGYSIIAIAWERIRQGVSRGELRQSLSIMKDVLRQKSHNTEDSYHRLVNQLSKHVAGMCEENFTQLGEQAYQRVLARSLYREAIALVEAHRAAGHHLVIVSAATRYQIDPIARVLGIDEICCTRLEVEEGHFTGKVITPLCHGDGKTLSARRVCKRLKTSLESSWFYTDSKADLPLLERVGNPVAVNPSDSLAICARANNWPQLNFDSRGLPDMESLLRTSMTLQTIMATTAIGAIGKRLSISQITNANRMTRIIGDVGSAVAGLELDIEGEQYLSQQRPAIFIFNHQSLLDSMVLAHMLKHDVVCFCKKELANNVLIGPLLRQVDTIFIDREGENQRAVFRQAEAVLKSGRSLVIAPEGTRSTLGTIQQFKEGAFLLAKKTGLPIIPIVLHNVKDALPNGGFMIRPAKIQVTVLEPIQADGIGDVQLAAQQLEARYIELLRQSKSATLPFVSNTSATTFTNCEIGETAA